MNIDSINEDIYYIENLNDKLYAHTKKNTYELASSFEDIIDCLSANFYFVNPNTVVNSDKIVEFNFIDCYLTLKNGVKIDKIIKKYNLC